jgi:uncharacterized damage-inducible protein DinB
MTSDQAAFLLTIFIPEVKRESLTTLRVLLAVPADKGGYRPHPNSYSALELAWHLASADIWFLDGFLAGKFEMDDDTMSADFSSAADVASYYEDNLSTKLDEVAKLPAVFWATPLPLFGMFDLPAVLYLQFMLNHSIHHRGQLSSYLRPMGAKVPSIYGGSFDEPMQHSSES